MIMSECLRPSLLHRRSTQPKRVQFQRMSDFPNQANDNDDVESPAILERQGDHQGDATVKEQINTDAAQFDALFARSNASPPPSPHPRCYSSCSPATIVYDPSAHVHAKSQPHLISTGKRLSLTAPAGSSSSSQSNSVQMKRKHFSLLHTAQALLQPSNSPSEQLQPLARSCSYKRPQSIKKYRQQKKGKEKEQKEYSSPTTALPSRKHSTQNNNVSRAAVISDSARKSISSATSRVSAIDLMANDDQWSSPRANRSTRIGSLPLDQLQLPFDGDEEVYRVRQFNTTSKGFVNRGDSFKRSFKRSGSNSRRSSFRKPDRTPSQEQVNESIGATNDVRTSSNSSSNNNLTAAGPNLNAILDSNYLVSPMENRSSLPIDIQTDDLDDETDEPLVERVETEDGVVQDIRVYQVYLLGMSGTGKCSLMRQFKTTEYRGIYEYSSSIEDDPDNTVSIMLDGIESRLHIINIDVDLIKCRVTGDAYVVVYSITDRPSFQTAVQLIKNIRENQSTTNESSSIKRHVPIILVGNKSDLVRKRAVTKETARHAAFRYDCKFVETSAAINDKVDDLLAGTLKQIRISEQQRRRLTVTNDNSNVDANQLASVAAVRKGSTVFNRNSKNVFTKFFNVFRKKPTKVPPDVENLNTGIRQ